MPTNVEDAQDIRGLKLMEADQLMISAHGIWKFTNFFRRNAASLCLLQWARRDCVAASEERSRQGGRKGMKINEHFIEFPHLLVAIGLNMPTYNERTFFQERS